MNDIAIVFDFDNTLTSQHLWKVLRGSFNFSQNTSGQLDAGSQNVIRDIIDGLMIKRTNRNMDLLTNAHDLLIWVFGGKERIALLKYFLMKSYKKADLYISSHGCTDEIVSALKAVKIYPKLFKMIHARSPNMKNGELYDTTTKIITPYSANKDIFIVSKLLNELKYKKIIYIDDSDTYLNNIISIRNIKFIKLHDEGSGINFNDMKKIFNEIVGQ